MSRANKDPWIEEHELLVSGHGRSAQAVRPRSSEVLAPGLGMPSSSRRMYRSDVFLTLMCLLCFALALTAVFHPTVAVALGQVNQLIALGVLLQLMAICAQRQLQYFLLTVECLWNTSSLQNYDSIVQVSFTAPNTSLLLRIALLLYLGFPLGLGAAYKNFTGGYTVSEPNSNEGVYGWTGQPGTKGLGTKGISLFLNTTSSWWSDPEVNRTYGFNLYVESPDQSALLDGPSEDYVGQLQRLLRKDETMVLETTVNATVCQMVFDVADPTKPVDFEQWFSYPSDISIDLSTASAANATAVLDDYSDRYFNESGQTVYTTIGGGMLFGMIIPRNEYGWVWNTSFIMTSRWNKTDNETFGSYAQGFHINRHRYKARWNVSRTGIALASAQPKPDSVLLPTDSEPYPTIENNYSQLETMWVPVLNDFDWKYSGDFGFRPNGTIQQMRINSDTTLIGAMVWSRLTTTVGLTNPYFNTSDNLPLGFRVYATPDSYQKKTATLRRSNLLAFILAVNPTILLLTLIIRVSLLHDAPISRNFGLVSLLASVDQDSLNTVKGAGYSGRLKRDVRMAFMVSDERNPEFALESSKTARARYGRVTVKLEESTSLSQRRKAKNDKVQRGVTYI